MTTYGYARVSTEGQSLELQQADLKSAGARKIFSEKVSGAKLERKELQRAIKALQPDDILLVTRMDRLARSTRDLLNILETISSKGAKFKSLGDPMIDTTTPHGKLVTAILGAIGDFERDLIKLRTDEGRKKAKANGVKFGRKHKLTPFQKQEAIRRREAGESYVAIARSYNVSHPTIMRLCERHAA